MYHIDNFVYNELNELMNNIGKILDSDTMCIFAPIYYGLEVAVRDEIEKHNTKKKLSIILDTQGGLAEVVERMVNTIRHHYDEVYFIIPNRAMSAGTIFAMSGDKIYMDYFSCMGPIDPQIDKDGKFIPAMGYIQQFDLLNEKAKNGELTSLEYALIQKLDLAELSFFRQASELSKELLINWLTKYKFKDWEISNSNQCSIDEDYKIKRAQEIAVGLSDNEKWHTHGRNLSMAILQDLKLIIDDYSEIPELKLNIRKLQEFLSDYMQKQKMSWYVQMDSSK